MTDYAKRVNAAMRRISEYISADPAPDVRAARKALAFPVLYGGPAKAIIDFADRLPSVSKVDYDGEHWRYGYDRGKAGLELESGRPKGSQEYIDQVEGWLMGDAERDMESKDA